MTAARSSSRIQDSPGPLDPEHDGDASDAKLRVLVLSHRDPRLSNGGAEIAAYQLFRELRSRPGVSAWFLSCAQGDIERRDGVTLAQPFDADSYVYSSAMFDHFIFANSDPDFPGELTRLLADIQPDVIHLHHYTNFGVDILLIIRRAVPHARIVLTLHEYLAICNHFGQMVKRPSFRLCERSGPRECHACFPERSPQDFFMRNLFIKRFFSEIDHFIAPSRFLADRYVAWGVDPDRVSVVENGVPSLDARGRLPYPSLDGDLVVGFFGQISTLKGVDVLFDAADHLSEHDVRIRIEIHGDYSSQPEELRQTFHNRISAAPKNIAYMGAYDNRRVDRLMQSVHAVLVPSIWWENSPLVIQEALANRRPVICSDIGGMAEKVRDSIDGFHFQVGSGRSLAALLLRLAGNRDLLTEAHNAIDAPPGVAETADQIIVAYGRSPGAHASLVAQPH